MKLLNHIFLIYHLHMECSDVLIEIRLHLLHFQLAVEQRDFDLADTLLDRVHKEVVSTANDIEIIRLPNQMHCPFIDVWIIDHEKMLVNCVQLHSNLAQNYETEKFDDVIAILLKYREHGFEYAYCTAFNQMEIGLYSLWMMDRFDDCLDWCEMGLHNSVTKWRQEITENQRFAQHTRFLMTYLCDLVCKEHTRKFAKDFFCFGSEFFPLLFQTFVLVLLLCLNMNNSG